MPFLALSFALAGRDADATEALCFEAGAQSVTFSDAADDPVLEPWPGERRLWPHTRVQALFAADDGDAALVARLAHALGIEAAALEAAAVADRAWEREWLRDYHAMRFGRRLWVAPHHETVPDPAATVVQLDPGLAFGTGTHASTALCLTWLDAELAPGARVIDYGCGSGILAVAAARLGAAQVDCFDIDPQALMATGQNAAANGVEPRVHVHAEARALPAGADVLLANIICNTLCELAPQLADLVRGGGRLVLAGILDEQVATVTAAYAPWFDVRPWGRRDDGWAALAGTRHHT